MVILLTGITGFIGRALSAALRASGHRVVGVSRSAREPSSIQGDFARDVEPEVWRARLAGVDIVINAVGILRETRGQTFACVHTDAPRALFQACAEVGVERVVQISALGADDGHSGYFRSKHAADEFLGSLSLRSTIVQPSLIYGAGGTSARLFTMLAALPIIVVPGHGDQTVQPIHIDDVVAAIVAICHSPTPPPKIALVGPRAMQFREMLSTLRASMGLRRAWIVPVPMFWMRAIASASEHLPRSLLDRETLTMLETSRSADTGPTSRLLGRPARDVSTFITPNERASVTREAQLRWLLPLLRVSIAFVWIWTGVVSLGLYPPEQSLALLERTGIPHSLAPLMLYGAGTLDLVLGLATLALTRRRLLWLGQIALIVTYSLIITLKLPEFWLHPYGPITKNLPMLCALYLLYVLEDRAWNT